ncbi:MAG: GNAT family N-acetyltransferase [Ignavibacteria bacterium]|jgi:RimJ/RimL family protein N-acetyltransferase
MEFFLISEQLGFRKWKPEDIDLATELWGNHEVTKLFDSGGTFSSEKIKKRLNDEIESEEYTGLQYWPIFLHNIDEFVGCCGLRPYDMKNMILELGVHLLPVYWGKGLAQEAAKAAMEYAFTKLKAKALFAGHNPENKASEKLVKRLGFKFRDYEYYPPTGLEHASYLLTKEDYNTIKESRYSSLS